MRHYYKWANWFAASSMLPFLSLFTRRNSFRNSFFVFILVLPSMNSIIDHLCARLHATHVRKCLNTIWHDGVHAWERKFLLGVFFPKENIFPQKTIRINASLISPNIRTCIWELIDSFAEAAVYVVSDNNYVVRTYIRTKYFHLISFVSELCFFISLNFSQHGRERSSFPGKWART